MLDFRWGAMGCPILQIFDYVRSQGIKIPVHLSQCSNLGHDEVQTSNFISILHLFTLADNLKLTV